MSFRIAVAVAENAYATGTASLPKPANMEKHIRSLMYDAAYATTSSGTNGSNGHTAKPLNKL